MKQALGIVSLLVVTGVALSQLFVHFSHRHVSMLLVNGIVYTMNDRQPIAQAVAIESDRIAAVGTTEELLRRYSGQTVIDLKGKAVYPGFIDSHAHLEGLGAALMNLNVARAGSAKEVAAMVAAAVRDTVHGGWIRGRGWDQNKWPGKGFPTRETLDRASPEIPVYLTRVDGHAVWVNTAVLRLAGVTKDTRDPRGGEIVRDAEGNPTGIFIDNAITMLQAILPPPSKNERKEAIRRAVAVCLSYGLTEVHDMGVDAEGVELYKSLIEEGHFPFRAYVALEGSLKENWAAFLKSGPMTNYHDGKLTVRAVKLYADGALGSRGAALFEAYSDDPGNRGLTLTSTADLRKSASEAVEGGFQVCTHAIGDRANALVLDVYEQILNSRKTKNPGIRLRIEHAQVLAPQDIPRFKSLGVLPMMQPTHCTSDMPWAESRLGPARVKGAYAWRSLMDQGCIIPGGSDFPVESPNPLLGVYAAITRQDQDGTPAGGWYAEQRMTREEAVKSFTLWGAYAGFQEHEKGSIEVGKWADLVVLSEDIMRIQPGRIPHTTVEMTIVGGVIVYREPAKEVAAR